jgi:hypothetical protein
MHFKKVGHELLRPGPQSYGELWTPVAQTFSTDEAFGRACFGSLQSTDNLRLIFSAPQSP